MPSWRRRLQNAATNMLALPPDAVSDAPRLTCVDGREIVIENVVELLHVNATEVRLNLGANQVVLQGHDFTVNLVAGREVHLTGQVDAILFHRAGGAPR